MTDATEYTNRCACGWEVTGGLDEVVDATIEHLTSAMGDEVWDAGMHPELPEGGKVLDNPYQYTEYQSETTHGARGTIFGEPGSGS